MNKKTIIDFSTHFMTLHKDWLKIECPEGCAKITEKDCICFDETKPYKNCLVHDLLPECPICKGRKYINE